MATYLASSLGTKTQHVSRESALIAADVCDRRPERYRAVQQREQAVVEIAAAGREVHDALYADAIDYTAPESRSAPIEI